MDPRNVHAYVIGEHGDSEFVPWSQALLATKPILKICEESGGSLDFNTLEQISDDVRNAAYKIIDAKKATYYGIGMALTRITKAILNGENSILTVSACLDGDYGQEQVFVGVPCILNQNGVSRILHLNLTPEEMEKFADSCSTLRKSFDELQL